MAIDVEEVLKSNPKYPHALAVKGDALFQTCQGAIHKPRRPILGISTQSLFVDTFTKVLETLARVI